MEKERGTEKRKLEHASAVPFNLRGNIFGVRRLSSVFYKVVTKVALIFTLAASFWQSARQENIVSPVLSDLYLSAEISRARAREEPSPGDRVHVWM